MTQEEKSLLFQDLCARLPYGVMVRVEVNDVFIAPTDEVATVNTICMLDYPQKFRITPYLRPMSSMTEDEKREYFDVAQVSNHCAAIDWLNSHHFDYRGLIEKELALKAPESMYNINIE